YQQHIHQQGKSTYFVGINGCQGSGKSTLTEFLTLFLQQQFDLSVVALSLDDFYFSTQVRQQLAQQYHLLFTTRGVPGTHDVKLLKKVLSQLKSSHQAEQVISMPKFDKAQDSPIPINRWPWVSSGVDIVLFEGWCWGVSAESYDALTLPINELEAQADQQGVWRRIVNHALAHDYQPLYAFMDTWLMMKAPSFEVVHQWRLEQEKKLANAYPTHKDTSHSIMSSKEIAQFIQHFQRLTEHGLKTLPANVDILFELDDHRSIVASRGL
ncbi:MAG: kinase, partial [Colwellia sp.]|nr:kinase [Colwellia sp.]